MDLKRDLEFIYEAGSLRFVQRTWRQFLNSDFQNVAEHTLRVMWISLILAKRENVKDIDKVIKMALIHDLIETKTGDVNYLSKQFTKRFEEQAVEETLKDTSIEELKHLWYEYKKRESIESKIVKDADFLDIDVELQEQSMKGNNIKRELQPIREAVYQKLFTKSAKELWKLIQQSNPHERHIKGTYAFILGDTKKDNELK